jgi:hypothetical protein
MGLCIALARRAQACAPYAPAPPARGDRWAEQTRIPACKAAVVCRAPRSKSALVSGQRVLSERASLSHFDDNEHGF